MRYSITFVVAALSVGQTMAGPAHAHLHKHRDLHAKKDVVDWDALDWNAMGIDWTSAYWAGQHTSTTAPAPTVATPSSSAAPVVAEAPAPAKTTAAPVVVATPTTAAAPESSASSPNDIGSEIGSVVSTVFSNIKGLSEGRTSFGSATPPSGTGVDAIGNHGLPDGSNIIAVDDVGSYPFTTTFKNTQSVPITILLWNKAMQNPTTGEVEANLGSCLALTSPALSITIAAGSQQVVAFDNDSHGAWAQATSATTASGALDASWGEFSFATTGSGFDVSAIMNSNGDDYDMQISALETPCKSTMSENYWYGANNNSDDPVAVGDSDGSCYIPGGKATLTCIMGGTV